MYLEIGQTAVIDGKKIKCVADYVPDCTGCIYKHSSTCTLMECSSGERLDNKGVHFILDEESL